ncbi:hypothetical protein [Flavobacterium granuli]|uniref:HEAT repeat domain-containing protein n=1 Tax=Flavobacterium granuli TaxID=280093 RepID=A0ABU1S4J1_9FLAO|nr:hypothetical protein [Flavobacterium granuli]MDR6845947.1 hypothetical protein [Flavobacterium granuli]
MGKNYMEIESTLLYLTISFIVLSIFIFSLTIYSRYKKIRIEQLKAKYNPVIEDILMSVLFVDVDYETIKNNSENKILFLDKILREQMIVSIMNLHENYGGAYAGKLKKFYFESDLIQDSYAKFRSSKWEVKCKGIKELSEMNVSEVFDELASLTVSDNQTVAITAINACIKLDGTNGIIQLSKYIHHIDVWTQLNIIDALKLGDIDNVNGIELLLTSENDTIVSLGLKIIQSFRLSNFRPLVLEFVDQTKKATLKNEADNVAEILLN